MRDWLKEFKLHGAIWLHCGDPRAPHALLTSGLHSDGFVNTTAVTCRPELIEGILKSPDGLGPHLEEARGADWVIGSAMGAITLAHSAASVLRCRSGFTEKDGDRMTLARFHTLPGEKVLLVEDVITTGGSTLKTFDAVAGTGAEILPFLLALVNRSGRERLHAGKPERDRDGGISIEIRALITLDIKTWRPDECPLCKNGSASLRPKACWEELVSWNK